MEMIERASRLEVRLYSVHRSGLTQCEFGYDVEVKLEISLRPHDIHFEELPVLPGSATDQITQT
jgi:hypothetical protein